MTIKLDRIDIKILAELMKDGRISNVRLSEHVGLSPSPCLQRIRRMEAAGIISGYGAFLDMRKVAQVVTIFTEFTLADHRSDNFSRFEQGMARVPEVMECHLISGGYDYLVKFIAKSILDYQELIEQLLERNLGVTRVQTH
ncbi:Lrp/AsnC family transcriptional regulator [Falsirhodobacter xinxiangensis]|uniref:Lrp/AsnC family transcriptional regulator n=1 Tax=Falsirhodobacter xinxiangensis TaxID=2530049 RepID=UPI0010AA0C84|nr:Lrp/AsnC family transcriptional regulator [Rhodobacter xinxiangensis]